MGRNFPNAVKSDPGGIQIKEWAPETAYLKELNAVAKDGRYVKYLELRKENSLPTFYFNIANMFFTILILLLSSYYFAEVENHVAEIHTLFLFTLVGTFLMTSFTNLTTLFIGIETMSIPLYILAGSKKKSISSNEAA